MPIIVVIVALLSVIFVLSISRARVLISLVAQLGLHPLCGVA